MSERSTCVDINTRGGMTFVSGNFGFDVGYKEDRTGTFNT